MFDIFSIDENGKKFNHKKMKQFFSKEQVTEELDNIPNDRFIHTVNPQMQKMILAQKEYDYKPNEEPNMDCIDDIARMDITERKEVLENAKKEIEYTKKKTELEKERKENEDTKKAIRRHTKKILEEE